MLNVYNDNGANNVAKSEVDAFLKALLQDGPFDPVETERERQANVALAEINEAKANGTDELDIEFMIDDLRTILIAYVYGGEDPFDVPKAEIAHALENPLPDQQFASLDHRKKISGPNRAIRAKCMECQGNQQTYVRHCPTINCLLWPFRMAGNPLYGRLAGIDEDTEIVDSEADIDAMEAERKPIQAETNDE